MPGLASLLRRRTTNPRAGARRKPKIHIPILQQAWTGPGLAPWESPVDPANPPQIGTPPGGKTGGYVGSYQIGGEVGVSPEEVEMAAEIYAMATPEQQAQITGGGGGPGMMDEEAAIGEALAARLFAAATAAALGFTVLPPL